METEYSKYEPIFGSWKIVKLIGEGSYGKVYEIEREDFDHKYKAALKIISIPKNKSDIDSVMYEGMDEESVSTYFRSFVVEMTKEFALMDRLKGKTNVVNYLDHQVIEHQDEIGWDVLIRMELLTPLNQYVKQHSITRKDVALLGIDICNALEACEQLSIIHRDIKVENIFVSEFGDYKLGDFGIARVAEKTTGASTKIGTNSYMAPEIMRGENYDQRVDIYSLGLVLYRLLNKNRLPFLPPAPEPISFSQREEANAKRFRGDDFPVPSEADDSLCEIIFKATAFNPDDRYQSAKEFKKALEKYVGIQNVEDETIDPVPPIVSPVNPPQKEAVVSVASDDDDDDTIIAVPKPIDNDEKKDEIDNGRKKKIIFSLVAVIILLITIICGVVFKIYFEKNKNKEEYLTENTTTNSIMTEKVNETETDDQNDFVKETDNNAETEIVEEKEDENDNVYIYEDYGLKVTLPDGWSLDETKDIDEDIRIEISDNEQEPNWINIYKMNAIGLREDRRTLYAASQQSKYEVTRVEVIDFLGRDVESFYLEDSDDGNGAIRILNMDYGDYYIGIRFFSPMCEKDKIDEMMQFISAYPEKELPKEYAGMNVRFPDGWTKVDNPDDSTFEVYVVPTEEYNALSEGQISAPTTFFGVRSDTDGTADWTDKIWYQNTWGEWEIGSMLFMGKDRFYTEYITEGQQICRYIFISIPEKYNKLYYAVVIQASSKDEIEEIAGYFTAK